MEQITVKLTPTNPSNPTITRNVTSSQLILSDLEHDTYQLQITSTAYKPYSTQIIFNGDATLNLHLEALVTQVIEWRPKSKVTTIPITTVYTDDPTLNVGEEVVVSEGSLGKITETWEAEYINGVPSGNVRGNNSTTVDMVPRQVKRGTKVAIEEILTQPNIKVTYSTNTFVDNVRTPQDAVPLGGGVFEIRQWDNPTGALNIYDGNLLPNTQYTIALQMENVGTAISKAHFVIGLAMFGGKHFFNGVEKSVPPDAGQYDFTAHFPNSGKVTYLYQFTSGETVPTGDYFQLNFDNATNNTKIRFSNVGLYEGHVDPLGGG